MHCTPRSKPPNLSLHLSAAVQDQTVLSQREKGLFNIPRRSGYVPGALFMAEIDPGAESTNQHLAYPFKAASESHAHGSEGPYNRRAGFEDPGTAIRDATVQGLPLSASRAKRNSASWNRTPTEKRRLALSSDRASDDCASGGQPGTSGGASRNEGNLSADGEWEEQIRAKDELISTLKRQLTALGEQPMEEVVTLEVRMHGYVRGSEQRKA